MGKLLERRKAVSHFGTLPGSGTVEHCSMSSDVLGVTKDFSIYLPAGYEENECRYPVAYLFHPAGGNHEMWISKGDLPLIADDAVRSGMAVPMIVVLPDAAGEGDFHLGKHLGYFSVPGWDYEKYFHEELIPLIDSTYRTICDKKHRAIIGASMGGEAAISYAQKYPEYYGSACALCGIVGHPEQSQMATTDKAYADSLIANNPTAFVENAAPEIVEKLKGVRWYADCGDNDYFYEGNIAFFLAMKRKGIPIDYRMRSGIHGWYYWVTGMAPILQFLSIGFT
ncbi:MAG: esterase family protein [Muribaculaceae bacterium]|nr:esterase family protein [Muribaculaceae bacterium]MDE6791506.1 esterase family protein [Muribaculaceae bacterium]